MNELIGKLILPYDVFMGVASEVETPQTLCAVSESSPSIDPNDSRSSLVAPIVALCLKELELSRQEHQNQLLQLQTFELQTDRQVKLRAGVASQ